MSKINLPIINTFNPPFQIWETRKPNQDEMLNYYNQTGSMCPPDIRIGAYPLVEVNNYYDAAKFITNDNYEPHTIDIYIEDILNQSNIFKSWQKNMPSRTPPLIHAHQHRHGYISRNDKYQGLDDEINSIGANLSDGQFLFHGGLLPFNEDNSFQTDIPLSTTFLPQVAFMEALWGDKVYTNEVIYIYVLKVVNPKTNVFVYKQMARGNMKHEKEVLFASGATLIKKSEQLIKYISFPENHFYKKDAITIPIYVAEVEIS